MRFGKAVKKRNGEYRVANPGFRVIIPWVDKFAETHVRQRIINLPSQVLTLPDRSIFDVSAVLRVSVQDTPQDLYSALFATNGLNNALEDAGLAAVRDVLLECQLDNLLGERVSLEDKLLAALAPVVAEWGVKVESFKLSDCDPDIETAKLIQLGAAGKAKVAAAQEAATELGYQSAKELPDAWVAAIAGVQQTVTTVTDSSKPVA